MFPLKELNKLELEYVQETNQKVDVLKNENLKMKAMAKAKLIDSVVN